MALLRPTNSLLTLHFDRVERALGMSIESNKWGSSRLGSDCEIQVGDTFGYSDLKTGAKGIRSFF
jgi:hypothetical protein